MADHHEKALAAARDGRWDDAHRLVQDHGDALAAHIHAYLHRVEGDLGNARYWYDRAGEPVAEDGLDEELARLESRVRDEG